MGKRRVESLLWFVEFFFGRLWMGGEGVNGQFEEIGFVALRASAGRWLEVRLDIISLELWTPLWWVAWDDAR
jgi:hypothetical protein